MEERVREYFDALEIPESDIDDVTAKYRAVFSGEYGMEVLADILVNLCYFFQRLPPDNEAYIARYNVGMDIMERMGLPRTEQKQVFNAIMSVPIKTNLKPGGSEK